MEWVETTAKSVEEAKELALDQLHVDESDAEFEVLEAPRPGLFGRMRGEARVRARVRPVQPRPKVDRRERRRSGRRGRGEEARSAKDDAPTERAGGASDAEPADERPARSRQRNRSRGGTKKSDRQSNQTRSPARAGSEAPTVNDITAEDVTADQQAAIIAEFVEGLVDAFGYRATVTTTTIDEETVEVGVDGEDLGLLVGPRGNTLQAIHELSRSVVQRRATGTHHGRVRLDIAGYRERRREALERFTRKLAEAALETGVAQVLEPMSAADRKVVHDTANDIDGVHTVSEGEDARRHVVIVPDER